MSDQTSSAEEAANPHLWELNWVRDLVVVGGFVAFVWLALWLRVFVEPMLLALLFSYLLNPLVVAIHDRTGLSRTWSVVLLFAVSALLIVGTGLALFPVAMTQIVDFAANVPVYADRAAELSGITNENVLRELKARVQQTIDDPYSTLSAVWSGVVAGVGVFGGVVGTVTSMALSLALFVVYLFTFSCAWPGVVEWLRQFVPKSRRERFGEVAGKMDSAVGRYFRTRFLIGLVMGVLYAAGWGLAGVPYWLFVGMFGGIFGIVPYGGTVGLAIAILLRLLDLPEGLTGPTEIAAVFVWPTLVYGVVQLVDDWFLTPWLQGNELDLSFAVIILAVLLGGSIAGLLGMLLAVPAAACIRILWDEVLGPSLLRFAERH